MLPYFRHAEDRSRGVDDFHGVGGPQHVSYIHERHPLCEAFIAGAAAIGVPVNPDHNGASQEGVAYYQSTIRSGHRHSSATGYLAIARRRANLKVVTHAAVMGLDLDGRRVVGLRYRRGGRVSQVRAGREVILAAGTIGSPHLLRVSGIGDPAYLADLGVSVRHALTGVGANFQDHYAVHQVTRPVTFNERARGPRLLWEIGRWFVTGGRMLAFSLAHVGAFLFSREGLAASDLQFVFTPASYSDAVTGQLQKTPGMTIGVWQMRPESHGFVRAASADPRDPRVIQPNYLTEPEYCWALIDGLRWGRRLMDSDPLADVRGPEKLPGPAVASDEEFLDYGRARRHRLSRGQHLPHGRRLDGGG